MQSFIHNIALLASLIALAAGLWQDWGVWPTLQRMIVSYLCFFGFGAFLFLVVRSVPRDDRAGSGRVSDKPRGGRQNG